MPALPNRFKDTNVDGVFTVNGVAIGAGTGEAMAALAAKAILAIVGVDETANGVIGGDAWLKVTAQSSPDLTVKVSSGTCFIDGVFAGDNDGVSSLTGFAAPATNPRIDIVQISNAGVISRKAGTEAGIPAAPAVDTDNLKLAEVYNRVGQTSVKNTDDASNGYITNTVAHI